MEKRKYVKRKYTTKDLIRDLKSLHGADVYVFGQSTKLREKCPSFCIDTIDIIENLANFEYNPLELLRENKIKVEKEILNADERDINTELVQLLLENEILEGTGADNSYNWSSPLYNDIDFSSYKDNNGNHYVLLSVHRYGDVRGNYTDAIFLKFDYETEFAEQLVECTKYMTLEYNGIVYDIEICPLNEGGEVKTRSGEFLCYAYGVDEEDVAEEIKEYIENRNENLEVGKEIYVYDMKDNQDILDDIFCQSLKIEKIEGNIITAIGNKRNAESISLDLRKDDVFEIR